MSKKKPKSFSFSQETVEKLRKIAKREGRSMSNLLEFWINERFEELANKYLWGKND